MVLFSYSTVKLDLTACKAATSSSSESKPEAAAVVPVIDPNAKTNIVKACTELGFFKLTHHGFSMDFLTRRVHQLNSSIPVTRRTPSATAPGPSAAMATSAGLNTSSSAPNATLVSPEFQMLSGRGLVREYVEGVKNMVGEMGHADKHVMSKMMRDDEKGDSCESLPGGLKNWMVGV